MYGSENIVKGSMIARIEFPGEDGLGGVQELLSKATYGQTILHDLCCKPPTAT
jgi:hypothetical protein